MNTELLREDERNVAMTEIRMAETIDLLRQRLLEEREKNAQSAKWLHYIRLAVCDPHEAVKGNVPSDGKAVEIIIDRMNKAEAELAEARKALIALYRLLSKHISCDALMEGPRYYITSIQSFGIRFVKLESEHRAAIDAAMKEGK